MTQTPPPLHVLVEQGLVRRKPGRPAKAPEAPSMSEVAYAAVVDAFRQRHVAADPLVQALDVEEGSREVLKKLIQELALESAVLKAEIRSAHLASRSDNVCRAMSRRVDALSKIAAIVLEMAKLGLLESDPRSASIQMVYRHFMDTVARVAAETLPAPDGFTARCDEALAGWEDAVD